MVPYRARLAIRVARVALALLCLSSYPFLAGARISWALALIAAYASFAVGALFEKRFDVASRAAIALIVDVAFFGFWVWLVPSGWVSALLCAFLLASTLILHDMLRVILTAVVAMVLILLTTPAGFGGLALVALAAGALAIGFAAQKAYLERHLSSTLRHNVIIRSQAIGAREAERQRIAADFHDGPLQSFISFQMRLEIVRKLMGRDVAAAADELRQLQDLCRSQVGELRSFVRSMRPADEGMSLNASLSRMVEQFQKDTGIATSFSSSDFNDPAETEVSLEILQIVREAFNNIQKHSGASRVVVSIEKRAGKIEISIQDNGGGFSFNGSFTLDELELLRLGPVSIKRRVRMLGGDLVLDSKPGQGAGLQVRLPV